MYLWDGLFNFYGLYTIFLFLPIANCQLISIDPCVSTQVYGIVIGFCRLDAHDRDL
jgi:hypothetical protein